MISKNTLIKKSIMPLKNLSDDKIHKVVDFIDSFSSKYKEGNYTWA